MHYAKHTNNKQGSRWHIATVVQGECDLDFIIRPIYGYIVVIKEIIFFLNLHQKSVNNTA